MSDTEDQANEDLVDFDEEDEQSTDFDEQKRRLGLGVPSSQGASNNAAAKPVLNPQAKPFFPNASWHPSQSQNQPQLKRGWNRFSGGGRTNPGVQDANGPGKTAPEPSTNKRLNQGAEPKQDDIQNVNTSVLMAQSPNDIKETSATELYVSNIPPPHNTIVKLAAHFSQFGEISNVKVDARRSSAVVQFAQEAAATAAFTSHIPVLNNRLIRVERYKGDMALHGQEPTPDVHGPPLKASIGRNMTYRAPASAAPPGSVAPESAEGQGPQETKAVAGLYDMPEIQTATQGHRRVENAALVAHSKEVHKAAMLVSLQEKYLESARRKRAALSEKLKEIKGRLDEAAKMGKKVDPSLKASLMAEFLSVTSEVKTAQASEASYEGKVREAVTALEKLKKNPPVPATYPSGTPESGNDNGSNAITTTVKTTTSTEEAKPIAALMDAATDQKSGST